MKKLLLLAVMIYLIFPSAYSQYIVATGGGDPETNGGKRDTLAPQKRMGAKETL